MPGKRVLAYVFQGTGERSIAETTLNREYIEYLKRYRKGKGLGKLLRSKYPKAYQIYQEIWGEIYYEVLGMGLAVRSICSGLLRKCEAEQDDPIATAFNYRGITPYKTIDPCQVTSEITELFNTVDRLNPKVVCEIGTDKGGTLYLWSKAARSDATVISIDLPRLYRKSLNRFFRSFFSENQEASFIRGNSRSKDCVDRLARILDGRKIDYLFIDGDHSYEGVKHDFLNYRGFVKEGGLIAFHDILPDTVDRARCDVDRFWSIVKHHYEHREIIGDPNQTGAGIGLLYYESGKEFNLP